jgi:putative peptidoglycan lipid II flippase
MSVAKAAFVVSAVTFVSRMFGYARDILVAYFLGSGPLADAFFVAYRIPNLVRQITAEGAFQNAFIPIYARILGTEGEASASRFAARALGWMLLALVPVCVLAIVFMPELLSLFAWGFRDDPSRFEPAVSLGRIIFPYVLCVSVLCLYGGTLNGRGSFFPFTSACILLNIAMIIGALYMRHWFPTVAEALSWSILLGGAMQIAWIVFFAVRKGAFVWPAWPSLCRDVGDLGRRMGPGILGGGVTQINLWANTLIATFFPGMVSTIYYADRLLQFPMALIGTALGIALLPSLSRHTATGDIARSRALQQKTAELAMLLALPSSVGMCMLARPVIAALFERGEFTAADTENAALMLQIFMFGLPAFVLNRILSPVFFAHGDTKRPALISLATLLANVAVTLAAIPLIGQWALAVGPAVAAWGNALLHVVILRREGRAPEDWGLRGWLPLHAFACACMAASLWAADAFLPMSLGRGAAFSLACIFGGALVYALALTAFPRYRMRQVKALLGYS